MSDTPKAPGGDALAETLANLNPPPPAEPIAESVALPSRYLEREAIGRGGMGDIRLFEDSNIGRDVAVKTLRRVSHIGVRDRERFVQEALVQARLEHPSIVPVYDLGVTQASSDPFFTMRRVSGKTLADAIKAAKTGNDSLSRNRMLAGFVRVCQAVDYAHSRGVIHRDIKPANIMFGEFGEVYLLDWGIAKALGADETTSDSQDETTSEPVSVELESGGTRAGEVLGTPGYMPPEQLLGYDIDSRVDVFALGCVLYELLSLEGLHKGKSLKALMKETTEAPHRAARLVRLEERVGPELASVVVRATERDPAARFGSVADMWHEIEAYLEGDRDEARRQTLAKESAERGAKLAEQAIAGDDDARRKALAHLGQSLAYDPSNGEAGAALVELLVNPPAAVPQEVELEVAASMERSFRRQSIVVVSFYSLAIVLIPLLGWWQGIRSGATVVTLMIAFAATAASGALYLIRKRGRLAQHFLSMALTAISIGLFSRFASPFLVVPGLAAVAAALFCFHYRVTVGVVGTVLCMAAATVPLILEGFGVVSSTFHFQDGELVILPTASELVPLATTSTLVFIIMMTVIAPAIVMMSVRAHVVDAERRARLQSWQLKHLIIGAK